MSAERSWGHGVDMPELLQKVAVETEQQTALDRQRAMHERQELAAPKADEFFVMLTRTWAGWRAEVLEPVRGAPEQHLRSHAPTQEEALARLRHGLRDALIATRVEDAAGARKRSAMAELRIASVR
jgi:hypothetical protein